MNLWLVGQARVYSDTVTAARQERSAIADLRNLLYDMETGQRGYLLTGDRGLSRSLTRTPSGVRAPAR